MKKCKFTSVAKFRYLLTALLILTGVTSVYGADIWLLRDRSCDGGAIAIQGEIKANDSQKLQRLLASLADHAKNSAECRNSGRSSFSIRIKLDSIGGDVDVALDIGRIIRRENASVDVMNGNKCFSSCVFLLAAGVQRMTIGDVGIHRPYFVSLSHTQDAREVRAARDASIRKIRAYFDEMDIPQGLLDLMLSIPPEKMKVLNDSELESFRLSVDDPTREEMNVAKTAYRWNLTSAEYRKRSARSDAICPLDTRDKYGLRSRNIDCVHPILLNITEQEYKKRVDKFYDVCKYSQECFRDIVTLGK